MYVDNLCSSVFSTVWCISEAKWCISRICAYTFFLVEYVFCAVLPTYSRTSISSVNVLVDTMLLGH